VSGQISRNEEIVRMEARTMRLLLYLAGRPGEVVSIDELLKEVWSGVIVTSDSVYQAVTSLRRVLGDDPKQPSYIATVPRRGYRMVATVSVPDGQPVASSGFSPESSGDTPAPPADGALPAGPRRRTRVLRTMGLTAGVVLSFALVASLMLRSQFTTTNPVRASVSGPPARNSIAVVPFIDLTKGMSHEYFADGVTEEVIDKLSRVPSLQIAPPTSSFYLKGKQIAIRDIARTLGVAYVLDGSVRKSGATLRVAARLSRGDAGYVVWSQTYECPLGDVLKVQDEIALEMTEALRASFDTT
jgi:TolB-like protein/DNA-binding winged helix-turn-helix (wHTH) protein